MASALKKAAEKRKAGKKMSPEQRAASKGMSARTVKSFEKAAGNVSRNVKLSKSYSRAAEKVARAGGGAIAAARAGLAAFNKGRATPVTNQAYVG